MDKPPEPPKDPIAERPMVTGTPPMTPEERAKIPEVEVVMPKQRRRWR